MAGADQKASAPSTFRGTGINDKRAMGVLHFLSTKHATENEPTAAPLSDARLEWERMQVAIKKTAERLSALRARAHEQVGAEEAEIFEIHAMLLEDEDFLERIRFEIESGKTCSASLDGTADHFSALFASLGDPYLSARASDIRDVTMQIKQALTEKEEETSEKTPTAPYILVADDLSPSQTVILDRAMILGIVTFRGSKNSHSAILSRAMGIPALVNVGDIDADFDGCEALLDAADGSLTVCPDDKQKRAFLKKKEAEDRTNAEHDRYLRSLLEKPSVTRSGQRMLIYANIGDAKEIDEQLLASADGIGLLRSEFLYLGRTDYPSEETLFEAYRDVAVRMQGKRAVIRTLDVGADKQIPYFALPREENPALGFRAIRVCLAREEIFKTQLRAILRASAYGTLSVMLPMIVSVSEVRAAKRLIEVCRQELSVRGVRFDERLEFGIMIETPAAAIICEELADEVDFFSVGTNDLAQYTLAADRQNPAVAHLCDENREPVLRLIRCAADAMHRRGGWIGICGEMAADPTLTQAFVDMHIDELSVSPPYLLATRENVIKCK